MGEADQLTRASWSADALDDDDLLLGLANGEDAAAVKVVDAVAHQRSQWAAMAGHDARVEAGGAHPVQRGRSPADFGVNDQQRAAGVQMRRRLGDEAVQDDAAVVAGVPRALRPARRGVVPLRIGNVRGIGDYDIETLIVQRREQIAAPCADRDAVEPGVQACGHDRPARDVDSGDVACPGAGGRDRKRPAPGADVQNASARRELTQGIGQ